MSNSKATNLPPYKIIPLTAITNQNVTSSVTNIFNKDNVGIQLIWTGTIAGTFAVQVSADYDPHFGTGTWTAITLSPALAAVGSAGDAYADITQISAPYIRVVFTYTSGAGNLTGWITAKVV